MPEFVELTDVLQSHADALLDAMHTCMPGKVQTYDPSKGVVDVQPMVKRVLFDEYGNKIFEDLPIIMNVPVAWQRAGGFMITMPLQVGDSVLIVFSHVDTGPWRTSGEVSEPIDLRRMSLGHAFAVPCIAPDANALLSADTTAMYIGKDDDQDSQIKLDGTNIFVPASATEFVALADKVNSALSAIQSKFDGHTHGYLAGIAATPTLTTPPSASPLGVPVVAIGSLPDVSSTVLMVK